MGWHQINPLRSARGMLADQVTVNFPATGLFNNDGTRLLKVWQITSTVDNAGRVGISVTKSRLTNQNAGIVMPVVTDEGFPPGQIDWDDLAVSPVFDYSLLGGQQDFPSILASAPIAVLRPGWSLVISAGIATALAGGGFFWEWCYPEDLYSKSAGDSALVI
jgi:hypothetical protein